MKKNMIACFAMIIVSSLAWSTHYFSSSVLTDEDWKYMEEDNQLPAITIPETNEEYYNQWDCFKLSDISIELVDITYDRVEKRSPTLYVSIQGYFRDYGIDPDLDWDEKKVVSSWNNLFKDAEEVCVFGTFLQRTDNGELWYIERVKTEKGIWDRKDESFQKTE